MLGHKFRYFFLFVQILAAIILISFILSISFNANNFQDKLNEIMQDQKEEIYLLIDNSSSEKINEIFQNEESIEQQKELYEFIKQNLSFRTYTVDQQNALWLSKNNLDNSFALDPDNAFFLIKIDEEFQSVFKLKCVKGRLFPAKDFKGTGSVIPLLLGYDFQNYYDLDDIICDDEGKHYKVTGFLEKSSFYLSPLRDDSIFWLDKAFVVPLQPHKFEYTNNYDSAINSTFIITDDPENLQAIQKKSNELELYTFEFRSFKKQLEFILDYTYSRIKQLGFILSIILYFSIIGLISNLIQFINTHTKEFAIHLLCGGRMVSIIQRILIQTFFIIFIADIIVIVIHRLSMTTLLTIASSLLIGTIIIIYPAIMLSRTQVKDILRRSK